MVPMRIMETSSRCGFGSLPIDYRAGRLKRPSEGDEEGCQGPDHDAQRQAEFHVVREPVTSRSVDHQVRLVADGRRIAGARPEADRNDERLRIDPERDGRRYPDGGQKNRRCIVAQNVAAERGQGDKGAQHDPRVVRPEKGQKSFRIKNGRPRFSGWPLPTRGSRRSTERPWRRWNRTPPASECIRSTAKETGRPPLRPGCS